MNREMLVNSLQYLSCKIHPLQMHTWFRPHFTHFIFSTLRIRSNIPSSEFSLSLSLIFLLTVWLKWRRCCIISSGNLQNEPQEISSLAQGMVHYVFGLRGLAHFAELLWLGPLDGLLHPQNNTHTRTPHTQSQKIHTHFSVSRLILFWFDSKMWECFY